MFLPFDRRKSFRLPCFMTLFLVFVLCLNGCDYIPHPSPASGLPTASTPPAGIEADLGFDHKMILSDRIEDALPMAQPGGGIGISLFDSQGNASFQDHIININTGKDIRIFITFYSYISKEVSYKLMQFVDFTQTQITVDDHDYGIGYDFTMPANSYANIPISLHIDGTGLHELLFAFAASPEKKSLDEEHRLDTQGRHLFTYRLFVRVNNGTEQAVDVKYNTVPDIRFDSDERLKAAPVMINKDKDRLLYWLVDTVDPGAVIPSFIHVGTTNPKDKPQFAVIILQDWKQVEIAPGQNVLFLEMKPDSAATVPVTITMSPEEGIYDLTPICIMAPYDTTRRNPVRTSVRTGIVVKGSGS